MIFLIRDFSPVKFDSLQISSVVSHFYLKLLDFLPKLISAIIIFLVFIFLNKVVEKITKKAMEKLKWDPTVEQLVISVLRIVIPGIGLITAASQLGIHIGSIIAGVGVIGLAVSFAMKDTLENLIAGVTILIDKPFRVGDLIEIDGSTGTVTEITLRSTRICTKEKYIKIFPNSKLLSSSITNRRMSNELDIYIPVRIAYKSDMEKAREILLESLKQDERIKTEPTPTVIVDNLSDSSVDLVLSFTIIDPSKEYRIKTEYVEKIKKALDKEGIQIPFPCRNVYIYNNPGS